MPFLDRIKELRWLEEIAARPAAQLLVVFGRRRIGKTALLTHWLEQLSAAGMPTANWMAIRSAPDMLLAKFSRAVQPCLPGLPPEVVFPSWESALDRLFTVACDRRLVVVMDEFPWLVEAVPSFPSLLQEAWDRHAGRSQLILAVSGSHYHMMEREFLAGGGPLFGRATATLLLDEIDPEGLDLFLPRYSPEQRVETFAVIGGVPKYLEMWNDRKPVLRNIEELILSPVTIFRHEAMFLIQDEIAEPRTYLAILEAIGGGLAAPVDIARRTGIPINHIGKYLRVLLSLGFVRHVLSLTGAARAGRHGRYEIRDPYLAFHFAFVHAHQDWMEQGRPERLVETIRAGLDAHTGRHGYEELARRFLARAGDRGDLPFVPESVGRVWNRSTEIDVVAWSPKVKAALCGECKWTSVRVGEEVLDGLIARAARLDGLADYRRHYAVFSRSGFTAALLRRAQTDASILLFEGVGMKSVKA